MSLFDIAAGLSQFDDDVSDTQGRQECSDDVRPPLRRESSLCIVDETLQTIYGPRPAFAMTTAPRVFGASKSTEQLDERLRALSSGTAARSLVSSSTVVQPTSIDIHTTSSTNSADVVAKTTLRELSEEIEQLQELQQQQTSDSCSAISTRDVASTMRFLTEKYIDARLTTLPATPFVQLARRKALHKIQQLQQQQQYVATTTTRSIAKTSHTLVSSADALVNESSNDVWRRLSALTPPQHAMLQKLARVPDTHVSTLAPPQRELVQFAQRYELARSLSARALAQLQPHQQQIVRRLQLAAQGTEMQQQ